MTAAPDFRVSISFFGHPKTKKLLRRLGDAGVLRLLCLWAWVTLNRVDGDLAGLSDEDLELTLDWPEAQAGRLISTLVEVGFIDGEPGSRSVHDWIRHNPWVAGAEARSEKARWAALCMRHGRAEAARHMPEYASRQHAASAERASSNNEHATGELVAQSSSAPSPSPSPSPRAVSEELRSSSPISGKSEEPEPAGKPAKQDQTERLAQVTDDAIGAWNASALVKPNGGLLATVSATVGRDNRQHQVKRVVKTARAICAERYGGATITADFWADYFAVAHEDDFHAGRQQPGRGHEGWLPDFEFMTRPATMLKLYERATSDQGGA